MERKSIGKFIAALRKVNGLTQMQLSEKLNVSDKAVSRWERDETAPDISLIPVIADIFGVTCDELLCGERKINNEASSGDDEVLSAKGEKQRRRILAVGLSQYKNRSFISVGIALIGLIFAAICDLLFLRGYLAFFLAAAFFIMAIICQAVILNKALLSVADDDFPDGETGIFKKKVICTAEAVIGFITTLTAFNLPLLMARNASKGVELLDWVFMGLMYAAVTAFLFIIFSLIINSILSDKGVWENKKSIKRKRRNALLASGLIIGLAAAVALNCIAYNLITYENSASNFIPLREFTDYESFAEFMERNVPPIENDDIRMYSYGYSNIIGADESYAEWSADVSYEELFENGCYGFVDNGERIIIKDAAGNILLECESNNKGVEYVGVGGEVDGWLPITVRTYYDLQKGANILRYIKSVFYAIAAAQAAAILSAFAFVIYIKKKEI